MDKPYRFINREKIWVKGLGLRTTYFVEPIPSTAGSAASRTCQSCKEIARVDVEQCPPSVIEQQVIGRSAYSHRGKSVDNATGRSKYGSTGTRVRLNYKAFKSGRSRLTTEVMDASAFPETEEVPITDII